MKIFYLILLLVATSLATSLATNCPCDFCGNITYCNRMKYSTIPVSIPTKGVTRLLLDNNEIRQLFEKSFENFQQIQEIVLSKNRIEKIHLEAFHNLQTLLFLYLDNNLIKNLKFGTLISLTNLRRLFLNGNLLQTVPNDISYLYKLERISLESNRIKQIDWATFVRIQNLKLINLWAGNPLNCSCDVILLKKWFQQHPQVASGRFTRDCDVINETKCHQQQLMGISHHSNKVSRDVYTSGSTLDLICDVKSLSRSLVLWRHPKLGLIYPFTLGRVQVIKYQLIAIMTSSLLELWKRVTSDRST